MAVVLAGAGCATTADAPQADAAPAGSRGVVYMPELAVETLDGDRVKLADYRGKVLLVNFWATWCVPCHEEIPDLNALQEEYGPRGLAVVGVSAEDPAVVRRFMEYLPLDYPALRLTEIPPPPITEFFGTFPTTFVVSRGGTIEAVFIGRPSKDKVAGALRPLL